MRKTIHLNFNKDSEYLYDEIAQESIVSGIPVTRLCREYLANGMNTRIEKPRPLLIRR